ncbi:hypothetical protein CKO45_22330, partial [Paracraurococcus ruber]|nr:hypothetical protein [Paracraurococcus ruber]
MSTVAPLSPPVAADAPKEAAPRPRVSARPEPAPTAPEPPATPNPSLRLDPALGLVVLEFRDRQGRTATLPTERELAAYRSARGRAEPGQGTPGQATPAQGTPGQAPLGSAAPAIRPADPNA